MGSWCTFIEKGSWDIFIVMSNRDDLFEVESSSCFQKPLSYHWLWCMMCPGPPLFCPALASLYLEILNTVNLFVTEHQPNICFRRIISDSKLSKNYVKSTLVLWLQR